MTADTGFRQISKYMDMFAGMSHNKDAFLDSRQIIYFEAMKLTPVSCFRIFTRMPEQPFKTSLPPNPRSVSQLIFSHSKSSTWQCLPGVTGLH